jgi:hypothetical protein
VAAHADWPAGGPGQRERHSHAGNDAHLLPRRSSRDVASVVPPGRFQRGSANTGVKPVEPLVTGACQHQFARAAERGSFLALEYEMRPSIKHQAKRSGVPETLKVQSAFRPKNKRQPTLTFKSCTAPSLVLDVALSCSPPWPRAGPGVRPL